MKCDECLNLLESYVDGEAGAGGAERLRTHLATCASCANQFEVLAAENELYARYDRELQVSSSMWNGIAARIASDERAAAQDSKFSFAEWLGGLFAVPSLRFALPAVALAAIAIVVGLAYWRTRPQPAQPTLIATTDKAPAPQPPVKIETAPVPDAAPPTVSDVTKPRERVATTNRNQPVRNNARAADQSEFLFTDAAYSAIAERDTASHLEQAQNLLVSLRNIKLGENDEEVDVSYEKTESRRLLSENIVLRRDAETAGKFPAKSMLGSLEPFLIDIANLPDKAKPADVRQITDRVQRTEIVAELRSY